jgi:ADP-heptose:LPS heptosyltransferase
VRATHCALAKESDRVTNYPFKSIVVITKYRYLGDTLLAGPSIKAIRTQWPDSRITLLAGAAATDLMKNCPYVDDFLPFSPYSSIHGGLKMYTWPIAELRKRRVDTAFVYHTSIHAAVTPLIAGAKFRVGWAEFEHRDILFTKTVQYNEDKCEVENDLNLVRGVAPDVLTDSRVELWLTPEELSYCPHPLDKSNSVIGLQPGATNNKKRWPAVSCGALINQMIASGRAEWVVLIGGPDELEYAQEVLAACDEKLRERVVDLVGKLQLRQSLSVMKKLSFFIGSDTAVRHTTIPLDVPSIGLFGPTNVVKWGNPRPPRQQLIISPTKQMADIAPSTVMDLYDSMVTEIGQVKTGSVISSATQPISG